MDPLPNGTSRFKIADESFRYTNQVVWNQPSESRHRRRSKSQNIPKFAHENPNYHVSYYDIVTSALASRPEVKPVVAHYFQYPTLLWRNRGLGSD